MSEIGVDALQSRIANIIEIHKEAEDLTKAEVLGTLLIIMLDLYQEIAAESEEDGGV